jgi:8-oxo-dGTP pyrophosphatase MutT (NUDIX family)
MHASKFPRPFQCYKPLNQKVYGSICITPRNTVLVVKGRKSGKWSFPKGHKNRLLSETYLECAVRETREETGIDLSEYDHVSVHRLSVGEYYLFEIQDELPIVIEDTIEIEEAQWMSLDDMLNVACNVDVNNFLTRLQRHTNR